MRAAQLVLASLLFLAASSAACQPPVAGQSEQDADVVGNQTYASDATAQSELLEAREAVWIAWFGNDKLALHRLIPENVIGINNGDSIWYGFQGVMENAKQFHANGGRLLSLEFPRTQIQKFGDVAILYSLYRMKYEFGDEVSEYEGRATEIFIRTPEGWTNPGWHLDSGS